MLKKTMTYTDYDGNQRTEDFYFNLSKAEILQMELATTGGFAKMMEKLSSIQDTKKIIEIFKDIILKAYGEKSPDGRRFIKNDEIREAFAQTEAYSDLFMEVSTNADAAAVFITGIAPELPKTKLAPLPPVPTTIETSS